MKKAIELVISEIEILLKNEDGTLFKIAQKMNLHFGVCFKLMRSGFSEQLCYEINHLGKKYISINAEKFNKLLLLGDDNYWFLVSCEPFMTSNNKKLARESLVARKTVLEGILETL